MTFPDKKKKKKFSNGAVFQIGQKTAQNAKKKFIVRFGQKKRSGKEAENIFFSLSPASRAEPQIPLELSRTRQFRIRLGPVAGLIVGFAQGI